MNVGSIGDGAWVQLGFDTLESGPVVGVVISDVDAWVKSLSVRRVCSVESGIERNCECLQEIINL